MEYIFPELKESEDERLRKGLIQHLDILRGWTPGDPSPIKVKEFYDAWIKWLEKQGTKKPAWSEEDEGMCIFTIKILNDIHYKDNANWLKSIKERLKKEIIL